MTENWMQAYLDAWNRHSAEDVVGFMTPDVVYVDTALGERHEGHDAVRRFVEQAAATFSSDYRFDLTNVFATDTDYAAEWTMSGTHDRTDGRLPVTGKPFRIQGVSVGRLQAGKIRENRDYWNMAAFLTQIGLMPQPAG
jgi:steroid delta-isomerase-like uncharacterized protein